MKKKFKQNNEKESSKSAKPGKTNMETNPRKIKKLTVPTNTVSKKGKLSFNRVDYARICQDRKEMLN